jgi:hypothetical protein
MKKKQSFLQSIFWMLILIVFTAHVSSAQPGNLINPRFKNMLGNEKIARTFNRLFPDATEIVWWTPHYVRFNSEGKIIRAWFDGHGRFSYAICYYSEDHLPSDVLFLVQKAYTHRKIANVTEVRVDDKKAYFLDMEDSDSWLKIKVLDGGITEEGMMLKSR